MHSEGRDIKISKAMMKDLKLHDYLYKGMELDILSDEEHLQKL